MALDLRPTCAKCGKPMDTNEMRAVGGNKFHCRDCYEGKAPIRSTPKKVSPIDEGDQFFANKEYACDACGYQFSREPTKAVTRCPFCGKEAVHEKVDVPASRFIE